MSPRPYITSKTQSSISSFPSSSSIFRFQLRRQSRREPDSHSSEEVGLDTYQPKAAVQGYSWMLVDVGGASPDRPAAPGAPGPALPSANQCRGITSVSSSPPTYIAISRNKLFLLRQHTLCASAADTCRPSCGGIMSGPGPCTQVQADASGPLRLACPMHVPPRICVRCDMKLLSRAGSSDYVDC